MDTRYLKINLNKQIKIGHLTEVLSQEGQSITIFFCPKGVL